MNKMNINEIHEQLYKLMQKFDVFCLKHNLTYSLAYGSMLGAVRHQGIIPWDDDLDVWMPREDYDKLLNLSVNEKLIDSELYLFHYSQHNAFTYLKVIDRDVKIREKWADIDNQSYGLFIDIFPLDKYPTESYAKKTKKEFDKLQHRFDFSNLAYDRESFFLKRSFKNMRNYLYKHIYNRKKICLKIDKLCSYYKNSDITTYTCYFGTLINVNSLATKRCKFGLLEANVFVGWEDVLASCYGDWRKLPPIEQRISKHALIIE